MSNILYLDHYAGSIGYGRSFRPYYLGVEWKRNGHTIYVVGGTFSHLRNKQPISAGIEDIDGITYLWLPTPSYTKNGVKRAYSMLVFMFQLFFNLKKIIRIADPDVIVASSVHMLDIYPAWLMKKLIKKKVRLVFELHDLWPCTLVEVGNISSFNPFVIFLRITERFLYKVVDKVISILPNTFSYMKRFGIKEEQFCHIPNGVVLSEWEKGEVLPKKYQILIDELKSKGKFLVGYAGTYSIATSVHNLINTAHLYKQKGISDVHFILMGNGPERKSIIGMAQSKQLTNVSFLDSVPKPCVSTFLKQMDALYAGLVDKPIYKYGISPNKIFDYMMSARPILQAMSQGSAIIEKEECGITVLSDSPDLLCDAILRLRNSPKEYLAKMGLNGKNYVMQHHNYEYLAKKFIDAVLE